MSVLLDRLLEYWSKVCWFFWIDCLWQSMLILWTDCLHTLAKYVSSSGRIAGILWQRMFVLLDRLLAYCGKVCQFFWTDCWHTVVNYSSSSAQIACILWQSMSVPLDRLLAYCGKVCQFFLTGQNMLVLLDRLLAYCGQSMLDLLDRLHAYWTNYRYLHTVTKYMYISSCRQTDCKLCIKLWMKCQGILL